MAGRSLPVPPSTLPYRSPRSPWERGPVQVRPPELQTNATAGNPWVPFYPSAQPSGATVPSRAGGVRPSVSGGQPQNAGQPPQNMGQPASPPPQVPNMAAPPQVPPIDVNSILAQWRSIQNPMLPRESEIPYIDDTAAVQAAMGRAKDTAGQQGRAAMDALMDVQGARGIVGSGLGVNEAGGLISEQARQLGDVNRSILEKSYETELQRQAANAGMRVNQRGQDVSQIGLNQNLLPMLTNLFNVRQSGLLQGRGQDIDMGQTNYQGGITQRGQDMNLMQALARLRY